MRAKKIFRDSANLWFVGLLTVQFCAGLVYALDAERVRNSGEEIKVKADSLWAFYHDNSAVQINMPAANSPYSEGACPEADAVFKSQSEYVPYWKRAECPVEFHKGRRRFLARRSLREKRQSGNRIRPRLETSRSKQDALRRNTEKEGSAPAPAGGFQV